MRRLKLVIDIDGVLADFNRGFYKLLVQISGRQPVTNFSGKDHAAVWGWPTAIGFTRQEESLAWDAAKAGGFWEGLRVHADMRSLADQVRLGNIIADHETTFVTSRPGLVRNATADWLVTKFNLYGVCHPHVITTPFEKVYALMSLSPGIIIEDKLSTLTGYQAAMRDYKLPACRLVLIDRPYNQGSREGLTVVASTGEALDVVQEEAGR